MTQRNSKILVTGATGMVGAHLLWHLLKKGAFVRATKRGRSSLAQVELVFNFYDDSLANYPDQFEWINADVLEHESIENAMIDIAIVYHCAAVVSLSKKTRRILDINIRGTQNVVYAAVKMKVKKICFVSSIAALGKATNGKLIDEKATWDVNEPHAVYAESKYLSEDVVWQAAKKGLDVVIVNPGVILGVADNLNNSMKIFSTVKKWMPIYTNGINGYVSVQDVCRAMIQLTESSITSERFVLVSQNLSHKKILTMVARAFNKMPPFINGTKYVLYPLAFIFEMIAKLLKINPIIDKGMVKVVLSRSYYSSEKIKQAIGFEFTPIEKTVVEICDFLNKK